MNRKALSLLTLGLCFGAMVFAQDYSSMIRIRGSLDLSGSHKATLLGGSTSLDVDNGYSFGFEELYKIAPYFDLGGGIIFELPRSLKNFSDNDFNFVPLYGIVRIPFTTGGFVPYFVGRLGYGFFLGNDNYTGGDSLNGGLYYSVGAGADIAIGGSTAFFIEGNYAYDAGQLSDPLFGNIDIEYTRFEIGFGLSIKF